MKKIIYPIIGLAIFFLINQCSGYKPIFSTTDLHFKIADHEINGDKSLGNRLYSKLNFLSKPKNNNENIKNIFLIINIEKTKKPTSKDNAGKILEYKITLNIDLEAKDFPSDESILKQNFNSSLNYKIQSTYSDTLTLEGKATDDLINKISEEILFSLTKNIANK